jgi:hypothetical protein
MAPGMVKPHEPVLVPTGLINLTDHDSRPMRTHGFKPLQGYNAQLAVNEQQVVIAAELTTDSPDFGHLEPMVRAAQRELRGVELGDPDVVLADAGYWHQRQIETVANDGIQVLVSPDSGLRQGPRPGWRGGLYVATKHGVSVFAASTAIVSSVATVRRGAIHARLACPVARAQRCAGRLSIAGVRGVRPQRYRLDRGRRGSVTLRLSARLRTATRRQRQIHVRLVARDSGRLTVATTRRVALRQRTSR